MQTFSIAVGDYEGFSFRVNPADTSIVEFCHGADHIDGDTHDGRHTVIARFKRNGGLLDVVRVPESEIHNMTRDAAGLPGLPLPDERQRADINAGIGPDGQPRPGFATDNRGVDPRTGATNTGNPNADNRGVNTDVRGVDNRGRSTLNTANRLSEPVPDRR